MHAPKKFHPLAIMATRNDGDIVPQVVGKLLDDHIEVVALDNWSSDGTFETLTAMAAQRASLAVSRWPETGPDRYYNLREQLRLTEEIALHHPGRWIIYQGSDEVRAAPWRGVSLREALYLVDQAGWTVVNFRQFVFRPHDTSFAAGMDPERYFRHYRIEHADMKHLQAWRQGDARVRLMSSGGHHGQFPGGSSCPVDFIIKHYQFRAPCQMRQRIQDRLARCSPEERAMGWHFHWQQREWDFWKDDDLTVFDGDSLPRPPLRLLARAVVGRVASAIR
jgi:hypothetical protein